MKSEVVDMMLMQTYEEMDLDKTPCIFLKCSHFFTGETLDGQMSIHDYYNISADDTPESIKAPSQPFSVQDIKVCPNCRGSLRDISRYGRIVRRGLLDESTKKFVMWATQKVSELGRELLREQEEVQKRKKMVWPSRDPIAVTIKNIDDIPAIKQSVVQPLFKGIVSVRAKIYKHLSRVKNEEQPFQRVADLVRHAKKHHGSEGQFVFDQSDIQLKGHILTLSLGLRCDVQLLGDLFELSSAPLGAQIECQFDLKALRESALQLVKLANEATRPTEEVEGHLFHAQACVLERACLSDFSDKLTSDLLEKSESLRNDGSTHVAEAHAILIKFPSTERLRPEIEDVEKMLRESTFYTNVSTAEKKAVYDAMASDFRGTGHWYTCVNGHPFTIGECGMPMQEARCPDCGQPVGGHNHRAVEGVQSATDMERLGEGVGRLDFY